MAASLAYEFGPYRLDAAARRLWRHGQPVAISKQACDLLLALLETSPEVIPHDALERRVWPGTHVSPESLRIAIHRLRRTLDDEGESPRFVEVIAKHGYRFRPPVNVVAGTATLTRSLGILPFECDEAVAGDPCGNLADALVARLVQLRHLVVRPMSTTTAAVARGRRDRRAIGQKLKVDLILDGRLDIDGDALHLGMQLVSVADDHVVWSQRFDGSLANLFSFEESISEAVAGALELPLNPTERLLLTKRETDNPEARAHFVRGARLRQQQTPQAMREAADAFASAVDKDPGYARAWSAMADSSVLSAYYLNRPTSECMPQARAQAQRALEIDPALPSAAATLAHVMMRYDWEFERAEDLYHHALDLGPANPSAHQWYSLDLAAMGRIDEALAENEIAQEIDPLAIAYSAWRVWLWVLARRPDEARQQFESNGSLAHHPSALLYLGWAHIIDKRYADAERAFRAVIEKGGGPLGLASLAYVFGVTDRRNEAAEIRDQLNGRATALQPDVALAIYAGLQDEDATLACLERCCEERTYNLITAAVNPALAHLRHHPRYQAVLRRVGLETCGTP